MRKLALASAAVAAAALATAGPAFAGPPSDPGCFGRFAAELARQGNTGAFVSGTATSPAFKGPGNMTIGQDGVPLLKTIACGP